MTKLYLSALAASCATAALSESNSEWSLWKILHQKSYNKAEDLSRFQIFTENKKLIESHNKRYDQGLETFYLGLTRFADMTEQEYELGWLSPKPAPVLKTQFGCPEHFDMSEADQENLPENYDWRFADQNNLNLVAVTSVKDQGGCGSCWTFGAAATMEGGVCMSGQYDCSTWPGLSEQNILDCASYNSTFLGSYNDNGCSGGEQSNAIRWAYLAGGVSEESDYPYVSGTTGSKQQCSQPAFAATVSDKICGTTSYDGASESLLAGAIVQKGPVTVGIDAGGAAFSLYSGGVYSSNSCSARRINHAVTAVGYGVQDGVKFWTIKNSWGSRWGIDGYVLMEKGVDMCGVERDTQYSLMA